MKLHPRSKMLLLAVLFAAVWAPTAFSATPLIDGECVLQHLHTLASKPSPRVLKTAYEQLNHHQKGSVSFSDFVRQLPRFEGASLEQLQNDSLLKTLAFHGYQPKTKDAKSALKELSRSNLDRLSKDFKYTSTKEMSEAEEVVNHLNFYFVHNTHVLSQRPKIPVFSSRQLEELGFRGGMNTQFFNREFMGTDDNVFFRVEETTNGKIKKNLKSPYGKTALLINSSYAEKNGWISLYIMDPKDFQSAVRVANPGLWNSFENRLNKKYGPNSFNQDFDAVYSSEKRSIYELRGQLHLLDFTVPDFVQLQRERYLYFLKELRQKDPKSFQKELKSLRTGKWSNLREAVQESFGYSSFEFKVPVAVPPGAIEKR